MSEEDCALAMAYGMMAVEPGIDLLAVGEMGIANTTSAAALAPRSLAAARRGLGRARHRRRRRGARQRKIAVVERGVALHKAAANDPFDLLRRLGGRELAAIVGAVHGGAAARVPVLLDGYAATGGGVRCSHAADPRALDHCLVAHCSAEPGHRRLLERLGKPPLLDFGMRLGEASGATLAIAILKAALACHNGMATFAEAGVSGKDSE